MKKQFLNKQNQLIQLRSLVFLGLSCVFVFSIDSVFTFFQQSRTQTIVHSLESDFRDELNSSNFQNMAMTLADYQRLELLSCPKLYLVKNTSRLKIVDLSFHGDCLNEVLNVELVAGDGSKFILETGIKAPQYFRFSFWLSLVLSISLLILVFLYFQLVISQETVKERLKKEKAMEIERISRMIAHDLRSPVMALKTLIFQMDESQSEQRSLLKQTLDRITSISEEVLKGYKPKKNTLGLSKKELEQTVEQVMKSSQLSFPLKSLTWEARIGGTEKIKADKNGLARVLQNLVNNSIEASGPNPQIEISGRQNQNHYELSVKDYGAGIESAHLGRVFSSDFTSGKASGHGLGLSYVREKVEAWGGRVTLNSQVDVGTEVNLQFRLLE